MAKLAEYRKKRDPKKTPEPFGGKKKGKEPIFVIQRHDARRLHYDFRLERNGALASWAVPKGVPLEPGQRALAVHVEDHPLEYATFEGEIPKGEYGDDEDPQACALREFEEETGTALPPTDLIELGSVKQKGGKVVTAWAAEGDLDPDSVQSNTFTMEWPPRSGRTAEFPEIDRAGWFGVDEAREKLVPAQAGFVDRLLERL